MERQVSIVEGAAQVDRFLTTVKSHDVREEFLAVRI